MRRKAHIHAKPPLIRVIQARSGIKSWKKTSKPLVSRFDQRSRQRQVRDQWEQDMLSPHAPTARSKRCGSCRQRANNAAV